MQHVLSWAKWLTAVASILASPIALMLLVPVIVGVGVDLGGLRTERMLVLLFWAPAGIALLRQVARRMPSDEQMAA